MENIQKINSQQLVIREIFTSTTAFRTIARLCPKLTAIHIFDQRFLHKATLHQLFTTYPHLEVLTINCYMSFKVLDGLPMNLLTSLKRICFRWDLQRFHADFFLQKYFPTKDHAIMRQRKAKMICLDIQKMVNKNSHLMILSSQQLRGDSLAKLPFKTLSSLQIYVKCLRWLIPLGVTTLQHLKVNGMDQMTDNDSLLRIQVPNWTDIQTATILKNNQQLKSVFFHNLKTWVTPVGGVGISSRDDPLLSLSFKELSNLPKLTTFSLVNDEKTPLSLTPHPIKRLVNLEYLNIYNVDFQCQTESDKRNHQTLFKYLKKLKHLSLTNCRSINSLTLESLHPDCMRNIQFLSLGNTRINENFMTTLSYMESLHSLNIEETAISGQQLIKMFKAYYKRYQKHHPLKHLNIRAKMLKWKVKAFEIIHSFKRQQNLQSKEINTSLKEGDQESKVVTVVGQTKRQLEANSLYFNQGDDTLTRKHTVDRVLMRYYRSYDPSLKNLSNTELLKYKRYQNLITPEDIKDLHDYIPNLEYLNIGYNFDLYSLDLRPFKCLSTLVLDPLIKWTGEASPTVKVVLLSDSDSRLYPGQTK